MAVPDELFEMEIGELHDKLDHSEDRLEKLKKLWDAFDNDLIEDELGEAFSIIDEAYKDEKYNVEVYKAAIEQYYEVCQDAKYQEAWEEYWRNHEL